MPLAHGERRGWIAWCRDIQHQWADACREISGFNQSLNAEPLGGLLLGHHSSSSCRSVFGRA
jgi:hypothetical protein